MKASKDVQATARFARMLAAMGTEPRLRIVRLLLSAHPEGMVVGEIAADLGMANSTLSHHLDKLRNEGLLTVRREGTFLRYAADTAGLEGLLAFLYAECCTRTKAVKPAEIRKLDGKGVQTCALPIWSEAAQKHGLTECKIFPLEIATQGLTIIEEA